MLAVGSLFSGIGGIDLGLQMAGMRIAWQCERDEWCRRILAKHWPGVQRYGDINEIDTNGLAPVDVVAGGFPCQPFSTAGKRKGKSDDRYLWPRMLEIISSIKPTWVLGENVAGLISLGLDTVLSDLERCGYSVQAFVVPAAAIDAPHRRDRVWVVAHANGHGFNWINATQGEDRPWAHDNDLQERERGNVSATGMHCEGWREWASEPRMVRMVYGVSYQVDRIRALGNAVVPGVVAEIGRAIICADKIFTTGEAA